MSVFWHNMVKNFRPAVQDAQKKADDEVRERRRRVKELVRQPFTEIDMALDVQKDNGGNLIPGRSGYVSARHLRRQRRYSDKKEAKITDQHQSS